MIKVLIIEDDPLVAELNQKYLERVPGFMCCAVAKNGEEALQFLEQRPVDLILLDIFMPGMNGDALLEEIRRKKYSVDVIVVSAARDNNTIQNVLRSGAVDYLIKPFEFERLQSALLAFKKRLLLIRGQDIIYQHDLDQQIFTGGAALTAELPKGLDRNTIKKVWDKILAAPEDFSAEEMAAEAGLSPVSIRKYLKYFQHLELLSSEIVYGAVGRPVYKYRCIYKDGSIEFR